MSPYEMTIESLKVSLPELTDAKFDKVYRQFFLKSLGAVLGYERAKCGQDWDQVMDVFAGERERRYGRGSVVATKEAQEEPEDRTEMIEDLSPEDRKELIERMKAAKRVPETTQEEWDAFCKRFYSQTSCKLFQRHDEDQKP